MRPVRLAAPLLSTLLAVVPAPALAAERSTLSVLAERLAMGLTVLGGLIFFAWVAWLAFRR